MIGEVLAEAGKAVELKGYAQDFSYPVTALMFSADEGENWTSYPIEGADDTANVNWTFSFTPPKAGIYRLLIKAERGDNRVSPECAIVTINAR